MIVQKALICSVRLESKAFLLVKDDVLSQELFFFYSSLKKTWTQEAEKKMWGWELTACGTPRYLQRLFWNELSILKSILQCCMMASYWDVPPAFHNDWLAKGALIVTERTTTVIYAWIGTIESELNIQIIQLEFNRVLSCMWFIIEKLPLMVYRTCLKKYNVSTHIIWCKFIS